MEPYDASMAPPPWRVARHMALRAWALLPLLVGTLASGMAIYHWVERLPWADSFLNAAMLLGGMGPVTASTRRQANGSLVVMPSLPASCSSSLLASCLDR